MALVFTTAEDHDADIDTGDVGADVPMSEVNISGLEVSPTTAQPTHEYLTLLPGHADSDPGPRAHHFDEGDDENDSVATSSSSDEDEDESERLGSGPGAVGTQQLPAAHGDGTIGGAVEMAHLSYQPSATANSTSLSSSSSNPQSTHVRRRFASVAGSTHHRPRSDSPPVRDDHPASLVVNPLSPPSAIKQQAASSPIDAIRLGEVREEEEDDDDGEDGSRGCAAVAAVASSSSSVVVEPSVGKRLFAGGHLVGGVPGSNGSVGHSAILASPHVPLASPAHGQLSISSARLVTTDAPEPLMPSRLDVLPPYEVLLLILQFGGENALVLRATCRRLAALFDMFCTEPSFRHLVQPHVTSWVMNRALPQFLRKERLRRTRRRVAQWQTIRSGMHASLAAFRRRMEPPPPPAPPPPAPPTTADMLGRRGRASLISHGLQHTVGGSSHTHVPAFHHPNSDELAALAQAELNLNPPSANSLTHHLRGIMVRPDQHHLGGGGSASVGVVGTPDASERDLPPPAVAAASPTTPLSGSAVPTAAVASAGAGVAAAAGSSTMGQHMLAVDVANGHYGSVGVSSGSGGAAGGNAATAHSLGTGVDFHGATQHNVSSTSSSSNAHNRNAAAPVDDDDHDTGAKAIADTANAVALSLTEANRQNAAGKKSPSQNGRFRYHYTTEWLQEWMHFRRTRYNIRRALFDYVTIEKQSHAMPLILPNGTICFSRWHLVAVFVKTTEKDPETQQPIPNTSKWIKTGYLGSHTDTVTCMKYDAHLGCLFTSSFDGTVKRWGIRNDLRSDDSYKNEGLFSCLASYRVTVSGAPAPNFHIFTFDIVHLKDYKLTAEDKRPFRSNASHRTASTMMRTNHTTSTTTTAARNLRSLQGGISLDGHGSQVEPSSLYSPTASEQQGSLSSFHTLLVDEPLLHVTNVGGGAVDVDAAIRRGGGDDAGGGSEVHIAGGATSSGVDHGGSPGGIVPPGLDGVGALPHPVGSKIEALNPSSSLLCCGSEWGGVALLHIDGRHSATLGVTSTTDTRVRQVRFLNQIIFDDGAPNLAADIAPTTAAASTAAAAAAVGATGMQAAPVGAAAAPNQTDIGGVDGGGGGAAAAFPNHPPAAGGGISPVPQQASVPPLTSAPITAGRRHMTTPLFQQALVYLVASTFGGVFILTHTIYRKVCEVSREDTTGILKTKKGYHYFATSLQMTRLYFFQVNELPASIEIPRPWWHRNPLREAKNLFDDVATSRAAAAGFTRGSKAAATASAFENRIADESTDAHPYFVKPLILLVYRRIPCVLATLNPNYNAAAQLSLPFGEGGGPKPILEKSLPAFLGQATCARISPNHAFLVVALDSGKIVIVSPRVVPITRSERNEDFHHAPSPEVGPGVMRNAAAGELSMERCVDNDDEDDEVFAAQTEIAAQRPGAYPHHDDDEDEGDDEEEDEEDAVSGRQRTREGDHDDGADMMGVQPEVEIHVNVRSATANARSRDASIMSPVLSVPSSAEAASDAGARATLPETPQQPQCNGNSTTSPASALASESEAASVEMETVIHVALSSPSMPTSGPAANHTATAARSGTPRHLNRSNTVSQAGDPQLPQTAANQFATYGGTAAADADSGTFGSPLSAMERQQQFQQRYHPHPHPKRTIVIDHAGVEEARAFFGPKIFEDRTIFDWQCRNPISHWDEFQFLPPDDAASNSVFHVATLFSPSVEHYFHTVVHMDIDGWKLSTIDVNSTVLVFDLERFAHVITLTMLPAPHHGISLAKSVERAVIAESRTRPANPKYVVWGNSTMLVSPLPITSHTVIVDFSGEFMPLKCTVTQRNAPPPPDSPAAALVSGSASVGDTARSASVNHHDCQRSSPAAAGGAAAATGPPRLASSHNNEAALPLPEFPMPRFEHHSAVVAAGSLSTQHQAPHGNGASFGRIGHQNGAAGSSSAGASPVQGVGGGAVTTGDHSTASAGQLRGGFGGDSHSGVGAHAVSVDYSGAKEYDVRFHLDTENARHGIAKVSDSYAWLVQNAKHVESVLRLRHGEEGLLALPRLVNLLPGSWVRGSGGRGVGAARRTLAADGDEDDDELAPMYESALLPGGPVATEENGLMTLPPITEFQFHGSITNHGREAQHAGRHTDEFNVALRIIPLQEYPFMFHTLYIFAPPAVMIAICGTVTLFALILDGLVDVPFTLAAALHFSMLPHYFGINWYSYKPLLAHHSGVSFYLRVAADILYLAVFPALFLLRRDVHVMQNVSWVVLSIPLQLAIAFAFTAARLEDRFEMRHHIALDPNVARARYVSVSLLQFAETLLVIAFLIAFSAYFDDPLQENSLASSRVSIFTVFLPIWIFLLAYAKQLPGLINQGPPDPTQRIRQLLFYYGSILLVYVVYFAVALMPLLGFCLRYNYYYECASHPNGIAVWRNATLDHNASGNHTNTTTPGSGSNVSLATPTPSTNISDNATTAAPGPVQVIESVPCGSLQLPLTVIVIPIIVGLMSVAAFATSNVVTHVRQLRRGQ